MEAARPQDARLAATDLACRRGERLLFRGLSFELKAGEALQVVGPNGTGKSSLLRILAGLMRPMAGSVERNVTVALLDERLPLDGHLPLGRAIAFWSRLEGGRRDSHLIQSNGLDRLADVPVRYLSTGQRKRAAILVSNTHKAGLWLLDEPLNGLDVNAAADFQRHVAGFLAQGGMVVVASHQPFDVPQLRRITLEDFAS
jgi:heme exporter protein A